jgi:hypothetical protein
VASGEKSLQVFSNVIFIDLARDSNVPKQNNKVRPLPVSLDRMILVAFEKRGQNQNFIP